VPIEDEADAIVACCWRYGSYFDLLTAGELYPPFRTDAGLSRLCDWEMKRINLEFSSGVSAWLTDRELSPSLINRRTRAAIAHLPMPWRENREDWCVDSVRYAIEQRAKKLAGIREIQSRLLRDHARALDVGEEHHVRQQANYAVNSGYRNGPIENFHAGTWSHGRDVPGFARFYPAEVTKLADDLAAKTAMHLMERDHHDPEILRLIHAMGSAYNWSLTKESSPVRYYGMPGVGALVDRVRHLAQRFPQRFGERFDAELPLADQQLHDGG
jgi:hypothetical protein